MGSSLSSPGKPIHGVLRVEASTFQKWEVDDKLPFLEAFFIALLTTSPSLDTGNLCTVVGTYTSRIIYVKKNFAISLFYAHRMCDPQYVNGEINFLRRTFSKLGYPRHVLNVIHGAAYLLQRFLSYRDPSPSRPQPALS